MLAHHPVVGEINERLRAAREEHEGLSLRDWEARLNRGEYSISYSSVRNYEEAQATSFHPAKMPPADYIAQVCRVFGYRPQWLMFGEGPPKGDDDEAEELQFQGALYGDLVKWAKRLEWATGRLRISLLRLLLEARDTLDGTDSDEKGKNQAIGSITSFVKAATSIDEAWFVPMVELPPRQKQQVIMHMTCLVYLLFRPFRREEMSFRRSKTLRGSRRVGDNRGVPGDEAGHTQSETGDRRKEES